MDARAIVEIYENMMSRQRHESRWLKRDGEVEVTDVGYATDGAYFFLEELLQTLDREDLLPGE